MQNELKYSWEEIEAVIDWLMSESILKTFTPHRHPTLTNLRSNQLSKYRQSSETYLASLGISSVLKLEKHENNYRYDDTLITNLSNNEQVLLDLLLTKRGLTTTYDEIASVLWPYYEDWSLYAIAKEVQRLRNRIRSSGIHTPLILAHRKVGYSLRN